MGDGIRIADMHCDTISALGEQEKLRENDHQIDLKRMAERGYLLQNFAAYVDLGDTPDGWERGNALIERFYREMEENKDLIRPITTYGEFEENRRQGLMSALLTVEEGGICEGKLERLRELHARGVRMMTLTWNYPNELGYPASVDERWREEAGKGGSDEEAFLKRSLARRENSEKGLTERGRDFVQEMEELGMIVDLSHLSDEGAREVLKLTTKPLVASHSNARAVCDHARNLPDDLIRQIGERGGCIGLNFFEKFVGKAGHEILEGLAEHAWHIVNMGGEECLGLGSDFDGIIRGEILQGAQSIWLLWEKLKESGFTERQLDGIFAGNVLRMYREML